MPINAPTVLITPQCASMNGNISKVYLLSIDVVSRPFGKVVVKLLFFLSAQASCRVSCRVPVSLCTTNLSKAALVTDYPMYVLCAWLVRSLTLASSGASWSWSAAAALLCPLSLSRHRRPAGDLLPTYTIAIAGALARRSTPTGYK